MRLWLDPIFSVLNRRPWWQIVAITGLLQFGFGLIFLGSVPRLFNDEAWEASLGHSLAFEGKIRTQVMTGCGGMDIALLQNRIILPLVCGVIFKWIGFSISAARLGSVIFSVVALCFTCMVMRRWFGRWQAVCVGGLTILNPWFFDIGRRTRPEIYYLAMAMVGLYFLDLVIENKSRKTSCLAGVFAGLACLAHPTGCVLIAAIAAAMLLWNRNPLLISALPWIAMGLLLTFIPFGVYVLHSSDPPRVGFMGQMMACRKVALEQDWIGLISAEKRRWMLFFKWPIGLPAALLLGSAWAASWFGRSNKDKVAAGTLIFFAIAMPFSTSANFARYLAVLVPFMNATLVRLAERLWQTTSQGEGGQGGLKKVCILVICGAYGVAAAGATLMHFPRLHGADFNPVLERIGAVVGPESRVYGRTLLWLGRDHYRYGPFFGYDPTLSWEDIYLKVREYEFDYAVRSAMNFDSSRSFAIAPKTMPPFRDDPIDHLCKSYGTQVDAFVDPYFGPFEVYKLEWD
jgi:uncharacterized membrane protein